MERDRKKQRVGPRPGDKGKPVEDLRRWHRCTGLPHGRPRRYNSPAEMAQAIAAYVKTPGPHNISGLALALGFCHRNSLEDYEKREDPDRQEYANLIAWAKTWLCDELYTIGLTTRYGPFADRTLTRYGEKCVEESKNTERIEILPPRIS